MRYLYFLFIFLGFNGAYGAEASDAARAQATAQIRERIQVVRQAQHREFVKSLIGALIFGAATGGIFLSYYKFADKKPFFWSSNIGLALFGLAFYATALPSTFFTVKAALDYLDYTRPLSVDALNILYNQAMSQ